MNCIPCRPACCHFYLGIEGGWAIGLGYADRVEFVGGSNAGIAYNPYASSGYHVGLNLGYRWNRFLRTDLSYTYLKPHSYKWKLNAFPIQGLGAGFNSRFKGDLHSHLVLFNTYLHLNAICCFLPFIDPYITGGVGVAINHLGPATETLQLGTFEATISSFTQTNFGARVGIGAMKYFCRCWVVDCGFNANYIGRVASDNTRTFSDGVTLFIGPYHFENNWIGTFYLGVKRTF